MSRMEYSVRTRRPVGRRIALPLWSLPKIPPEGETQMAYSLYDAAVTPCAQQLSALAGIIDKAAAHCAANKIEESALLPDRLYPDMFCLARQIRQSADFAMNTGGRLAGVTPPTMAAVMQTHANQCRRTRLLPFTTRIPRGPTPRDCRTAKGCGPAPRWRCGVATARQPATYRQMVKLTRALFGKYRDGQEDSRCSTSRQPICSTRSLS